MLELLRRGVESAENLAVLPIQTLERIFGNNPTVLKDTFQMTEEIIRLPFKAVNGAVEMLDERSTDKTDQQRRGGPTLRNVTVNPDISVVSDELINPNTAERRAVIRVTGLLCGA